MAASKSTGTDKKTPTKKETNTKKAAEQKSSRKPSAPADTKKRKNEPAPEPKQSRLADPQSTVNQILPFVFIVCAVLFLLILVLTTDGFIVKFLKSVLLGLFSAAAFLIPALFVLLAAFWQSSVLNDQIKLKFWCAGISLVLFSMLMHLFMSGEKVFNPIELYKNGNTYTSGGVVGGFLASALMAAVGKTISYIILFAALFVSVLLLFGLTPHTLEVALKYRIRESREKKRVQKEEKNALPAPKKPSPDRIKQDDKLLSTPEKTQKRRRAKGKFDTDVDISADETPTPEAPEELDQDVIDKKIFDEVMRRTQERYGDQNFAYEGEPEEEKPVISYGQTVPAKNGTVPHIEIKPLDSAPATALPSVASLSEDGEIDLSKIFVDPEKIEQLVEAQSASAENSYIEAECDMLSSADSEPPFDIDEKETDEMIEEPVPVYEFPPTSLLTPPEKRSAADIEELKDNSLKLVDTLRSFNVKTKVSDVSIGPTITRYELTPESGTRVRSISNLIEDIALGLAVPSVRIEAPIPGKAAVGVEVPNKKRENVYLRALLEGEGFEKANSRLTAALGSDVAGAPVYCDIAKMPHLLVSGATGMGKSVCINSIIVSLLYKSTPQEIRLIMVDPKKVELNIYNGIPHLHVPVVSDAKKAAGTLAWAVTEMERRYELIESVGVRNIQNYNEITYSDPEKEFMPQMVIIIDELADLMMTAPDDVETSICRIAQMGRAAGIHLIIGTQRPSVDVVTGLIKANIPSRIAFKMASQVDSRTVIDIAGAEKLLGRGDMLYSPVGVMKPQRVQGAFVSEAEVQKVVDFIKGIFPMPQYDEDAMNGIEEAAARCGQKKGRGGDAASETPVATDDPMLKQALELAVETGKISTSLIQRRLSLGYGRAAKLIDTMEARGFVSAPDGQRPRDVLITRQQYQELVLSNEFE